MGTNRPATLPASALRPALAAFGTGAALLAIFAALVWWLRGDLREEIRHKIIERDAAVLYPMALQQIAEGDAPGAAPFAPLTALLKSAKQRGMLAIAVFDAGGNTIEAVPATQLFVELPMEDYLRLRGGAPISRYHPAFPLDQYFAGIARDQREAPVLEVLLALPGATPETTRGFVRYFMDARPLAQELAVIDARINRQTTVIFAVGTTLVAAVMALAGFRVQRAQRIVAERNDRLARANFELTLAAKASAVGQITSHLIHGLQGSVAGLHAVVTAHEAEAGSPAWETAAGYTQRLQDMIQETVRLLGDASAQVSYELSGRELAAIIRDRNQAAAADKGVRLEVDEGFPGMLDSHRGSLLCLIASNLVQNAIAATAPGRRVTVTLTATDTTVSLRVSDEGGGIPATMQPHLFQPGRSGRPGGSGLGLAISRLLARQIGAELVLVATGPEGTTFALTLSPVKPEADPTSASR